MDTWFVPFTKEIGLPAMVAITFIWYFIKVSFPELKLAMVEAIKANTDTIRTISAQYEQNLNRIQEFNERMMEKVMTHNIQIHDALNKRIDGVVSEIVEVREEVSKRLEVIIKTPHT